MSLRWKFFLSYLFVVAVGLLVLSVSTAFVAPETFSSRMHDMPGMRGGMMMGDISGQGMMRSLDEELDQSFRESVNDALLGAGIAATLTAAIVSWFVSQRIVYPIRQVATASQTIAEGHYEQRLVAPSDDELGDLIHSFNRMASSLAETETRRRQLLADISHELKTPLASIKGYMEGLQDGIIPPTPETFELIHREADRLQRLVHDLQELSRAEAGALQLDLRPHDAQAIVTTVVARLQPQFADKGIDLVVEGPDDPLRVLSDRDRVEQVLTNLLGNALQYTPAGGHVTVSLASAGEMVRFDIRDSGIGLAHEDLERIFQRFYRVDKSRSRSRGGSGIGLTIARHIVEAHGGRLWAESPGLNRGSTFSFTLPHG